ncbi:hypothetical protein V9T40_014298 [Parthenolecanium corni]|uniref:Uncharacterized protein n=1 Tax=Parthenolecanium corni TaxID=536013 RepID=A0AAN9XYB0_9HEMI
MNSCFPPLATLNIGDNVNDDKAKRKNTLWNSNSNMRKLSLTKSKDKMSNNSGIGDNSSNGKIEVLQDLDLYYIKQIAHNMKLFLYEFYLLAKFCGSTSSSFPVTPAGNFGASYPMESTS